VQADLFILYWFQHALALSQTLFNLWDGIVDEFSSLQTLANKLHSFTLLCLSTQFVISRIEVIPRDIVLSDDAEEALGRAMDEFVAHLGQMCVRCLFVVILCEDATTDSSGQRISLKRIENRPSVVNM